MKKFKHIPTGKILEEYRPGKFVEQGKTTCFPEEFICGKDWQQISDPYTILAFILNVKLGFTVKELVFLRTVTGMYKHPNKSVFYPLQDMLVLNRRIYSIRRESDGQIFKVGDVVKVLDFEGSPQPINEFYIDNGVLWTNIGGKGYNNIESFSVDLKPKLEWEITCWRDSNNINSHSLRQATPDFEIYSVKRLSDGMEFKLGDKINFTNNLKSWVIIKEFMLLPFTDGFNIKAENNICYSLITALKKEKFLTTEDKVDIFILDLPKKLYYVRNDFICSPLIVWEGGGSYSSKMPLFASKENAEEYILMNKRCLSLADVLSMSRELSYNTLNDKKKFEKLIESLTKKRLN
jgi:hypothetical protein